MEDQQQEEEKQATMKKMLSWSESSSDEDPDEDQKKDKELKEIEKTIIAQRRSMNVVTEPQFLSRKVEGNRINAKFLRVSFNTFSKGTEWPSDSAFSKSLHGKS